MAHMKVFTLGTHGFVTNDVQKALGMKPHNRQARVLAVAPTKKAAAELLNARGFDARIWDSEFRQAMGNDVDALHAAGLLDAPKVLAMPGTGASGHGVVEVDEAEVPHRIGWFHATGEAYRVEFVAEPTESR